METDIKALAGTIIRNFPAIKFPLKHSGAGMIWDANSHHIIDIRGWGRLQYHEKGYDAGAQLQDAIAEWVVKTLNNEYDKKN